MLLNDLIRKACGVVLAVGLLTSNAFARVAPPSFTGMYAFGDSLSDNGNAYTLTHGLTPSSPYWEGRFSNGPVAVEMLASGLGLSSAQLHDYAVGGAQTSTVGQFPNTGMLNQVSTFVGGLGVAGADSHALYFVWGGANDLRGDGANALLPAVQNLSTIVTTLYNAGARSFFLPNMPDLGLTPEAIAGGSNAQAGASLLSESFNQALANAYGGLAASLTGAHLYLFDTLSAHRALIAGSPGNGFTNVTQGCVSAATCIADNGAGYFYWDQIHPTAAVHAILGGEMLAAVPEPQTVLLMAVGVIAVLGFAGRRQSRG